MDRRIGIQDHGLQLHIGRRPDSFAHGAHDHQKLSGDIAMQPIHKSPEGGLHRQLADLQDARQYRVARDEAQLVKPRKADVQAQSMLATNRYTSMTRGIRFDVSVSFTRDSKPSFSSI